MRGERGVGEGELDIVMDKVKHLFIVIVVIVIMIIIIIITNIFFYFIFFVFDEVNAFHYLCNWL